MNTSEKDDPAESSVSSLLYTSEALTSIFAEPAARAADRREVRGRGSGRLRDQVRQYLRAQRVPHPGLLHEEREGGRRGRERGRGEGKRRKGARKNGCWGT